MPSAFADAWSRSSRDIDRCFGDLVLYQPMMQPSAGGRPIADPARPAMQIVGALSEKPVFAFPETRSRRASVVAQEATHDSELDIASDALPYDPATGDRITTLDPVTKLPTGDVFQVDGPQPDQIARIVLRLFKRKSGT